MRVISQLIAMASNLHPCSCHISMGVRIVSCYPRDVTVVV